MVLDLRKKTRTPYLISGILMVVRRHSILTSTTQHLVSCPLREVPHSNQQQRNNTKAKHNTKKTKHPTHQQQQERTNHTMALLPTKHASLQNVIPTRKLRLSHHQRGATASPKFAGTQPTHNSPYPPASAKNVKIFASPYMDLHGGLMAHSMPSSIPDFTTHVIISGKSKQVNESPTFSV